MAALRYRLRDEELGRRARFDLCFKIRHGVWRIGLG
jgi:hypothetical protein